jgi:hypothetical protein
MLDPIDGFFGKQTKTHVGALHSRLFIQLTLLPGAFIRFFTPRMACRQAFWLKAMAAAVISCFWCLTILPTCSLFVEKPDSGHEGSEHPQKNLIKHRHVHF